MFELDHQLRRGVAHVLDGVLVAEVVAALDGVVHVPVPVVRQHVAERGVDAALRRDRVRARREHLGDDRDVGLAARELQRRAQAGAAGADDEAIEAPTGDAVHAHRLARTLRDPAARCRRLRQFAGRIPASGPGAGRRTRAANRAGMHLTSQLARPVAPTSHPCAAAFRALCTSCRSTNKYLRRPLGPARPGRNPSPARRRIAATAGAGSPYICCANRPRHGPAGRR